MKRVDEQLTANARALRTNATKAERLLWLRLSAYRPRFTRQLVIGLRLWNNEVIVNPDGAAEHILLRCAERLGSTHPHPLPSREGRIRRPRFRPER